VCGEGPVSAVGVRPKIRRHILNGVCVCLSLSVSLSAPRWAARNLRIKEDFPPSRPPSHKQLNDTVVEDKPVAKKRGEGAGLKRRRPPWCCLCLLYVIQNYWLVGWCQFISRALMLWAGKPLPW